MRVSCEDAEASAGGRWSSFRSDGYNRILFNVTGENWNLPESPIFIQLFEERVLAGNAGTRLELKGCKQYPYNDRPITQIEQTNSFRSLKSNTVYWLRIASPAVGNVNKGYRYSFKPKFGFARQALVAPQAPSVRLAPGETGVVSGQRCSVELDVQFDRNTTDYVELFLAGQSITVSMPGIRTVEMPKLSGTVSGGCEDIDLVGYAIKGCTSSPVVAPSARPIIKVCIPAPILIDTNLCNGQSIELNGVTYSPLQTDRLYRDSIRLNGSRTCVPDTVLRYTVHPRFRLRALPRVGNCAPGTFYIAEAGLPLGASSYTYVWSNLDDRSITLRTSADTAVLTVPGRYLVTATSGAGCVLTDTAAVFRCVAPEVQTTGLTVKVWLPGGVLYDSVAWYVEGVRVAFAPGGMTRYVRRGGDTLVYTLAAAGTYRIEALAYAGTSAPTAFSRTVTVRTSSTADYAAEHKTLHLFPNPSTTAVNFRITGVDPAQFTKVAIYNQVGKQQTAAGLLSGGRLDVSALEPGVYVVEVSVPQGVLRGRFLKL